MRTPTSIQNFKLLVLIMLILILMLFTYLDARLQFRICVWSRNCCPLLILISYFLQWSIHTARFSSGSKTSLSKMWKGKYWYKDLIQPPINERLGYRILGFDTSDSLLHVVLHPFPCLADTEEDWKAHMHRVLWWRTEENASNSTEGNSYNNLFTATKKTKT